MIALGNHQRSRGCCCQLDDDCCGQTGWQGASLAPPLGSRDASAVPGIPARPPFLTIPPRVYNTRACPERSERGVSRPIGAAGARHGGDPPPLDVVCPGEFLSSFWNCLVLEDRESWNRSRARVSPIPQHHLFYQSRAVSYSDGAPIRPARSSYIRNLRKFFEQRGRLTRCNYVIHFVRAVQSLLRGATMLSFLFSGPPRLNCDPFQSFRTEPLVT